LTTNEIAAKTGLLEEITKERLYIYMENLTWCGAVIQHGNTYMAIVKASSSHREREREREKERTKERERLKNHGNS